MAQTLVFKSAGTTTATGLPKLRRDAVLSGAINDGGRFLFDLNSTFCWPGQVAPLNGDAIIDAAEIANGTMSIPSGTAAFSGEGFDFTNVAMNSVGNAGVALPASVLNDIYTTYTGNSQHYCVIAWVKLPTLANWNASGSILSIIGDKSFSTAASLFTLNQVSGGAISVRRQTAAATADNYSLSSSDLAAISAHGAVVQIIIWRNATNQGFRVKTATGERTVSQAAGSTNTQNFSTNLFYFGRPAAFVGASTGTVATLTALSGFRVYRGYVENLARTGRDPAVIADLDWTLTSGRAVFT